MQYFTLVYKTVNCPMWEDNIQITAKYRYLEDSENPYLARFVGATCEVIENAKLPERKKDKRLGLYRFCRIHNCPHLRNFQDTIDVRLNHQKL